MKDEPDAPTTVSTQGLPNARGPDAAAPGVPDPAEPIPLGGYALHACIGRGGMGEVWRAVHLATDLPVAVKVLTGARARSDSAKGAFAREVRAVAALDHPGIVTAYDFGEVDGTAAEASGGRLVAGSPMLAMELGIQSLRATLGAPVPWRVQRRHLLGMLDGLAHAHARRVVHRDLKPANALLFADGGLKLCDFGLAWSLEGVSPAFRAGTPPYMAPEQVRGAWRDFGPWTDLYALGCTAWHLSAGAPPFTNLPSTEILAAHLGAPLPPFTAAAAVPAGYRDWLRTLLEKEPAHRYQTAADATWALLQLGDPAPTETAAGPTASPVPALVTLPWNAPHPRAAGTPSPSGGAPTVPMAAFGHRDWREPRDRPSNRLVGAGLGLYGLRRPPLVGREREREILWAALQRVREDGRSQAVVLEGAAGTGKSRLARWLCERAEELGAATSLKVHHGDRGGHDHGVEAMLLRHLRLQLLERHEIADRLRSVLGWDEDGVAALTEVVRPLERNAHPRGVRVVRLDAADRRATVARFVEATAASRPTVLWIDDAQWGAEAVELAGHLVGTTAPVLAVLTVRREALALRPFEAGRLDDLRAHARIVEVAPLAGQAEARTAGNPLFAVQLVGDWVQRGILEARASGWQLREGARVPLPDELHGLWVGRLEHLLEGRPESDRLALELAAVLGRTVSDVEWQAACGHAGVRDPEGLVAAMLGRDLATRTELDAWSFVHGMLRESLVRLAEEAQRADRHRDHCARALVQLGQTEKTEVGLQPAIRTFERALALAVEPAAEFDARLVLTAALRDTGRMADARVHTEAALGLVGRVGTPADEAWLRGTLALISLQEGRPEQAWSHAEAAHAIARQLPDRAHVAIALGILATVARSARGIEEAIRFNQGAADVNRELGLEHMLGKDLHNLGNMLRLAGRLDEARTHYLEALTIHRKLRNRRSEGIALNSLANLHWQLGELDQARAHHEAALAAHREVGARRSEGVVLGNLGTVLRELGRFDEARDRLEEALVVHRELGSRGYEVDVLQSLGQLHVELDRPDVAEATFQEALAITEVRRDEQRRLQVLVELASLHAAQGDTVRAEDRIAAAMERVRELGQPLLLAHALCVWVRIHHLDQPDAAADRFAEAQRIAADLKAGPSSSLGRSTARAAAALQGS